MKKYNSLDEYIANVEVAEKTEDFENPTLSAKYAEEVLNIYMPQVTVRRALNKIALNVFTEKAHNKVAEQWQKHFNNLESPLVPLQVRKLAKVTGIKFSEIIKVLCQ